MLDKKLVTILGFTVENANTIKKNVWAVNI